MNLLVIIFWKFINKIINFFKSIGNSIDKFVGKMITNFSNEPNETLIVIT